MISKRPRSHRFAGLARLARRFRPAASQTEPAYRPPLPAERVEAALSIPVCTESPEEAAQEEARARGQFLARQDRWDELAQDVRHADSARQVTPGGMPVADLLLYGARADVVLAAEHALLDGGAAGDAPLLEGIAGLEEVRAEHPDCPTIALLVALAHIDLGWAWRGPGWEVTVPQTNRARFAAHFERAAALLEPHCGVVTDSPALAAARCALLAGVPDPRARVADDYEDLIDLDPRNHRPMRAMGNHLLPRWYGSHDQLELEARRTAARTADLWGAGGYAWVCFDAIALDDDACAAIDAEFFIDGLRDIVAARPDQGTVNLLAAYCSVTMRQGLGAGTESDLVRKQIVDCARWLIRDHMTEVHPLLWAHAAEGFDNSARVTSVRRFAARGRADALQAIAEQFREDIAGGCRVIFTPEGPTLHPA